MNPTKTLKIVENRAVLVGIDDYLDRNIGSLRYAVRDVHSLYDILVDGERGKYDPSLVYLVTNDSEDKTLLPMKSNIMASVKTMSKSASNEDSILFFFSGHGVEREGRAYLLPYESRTNVISDTALPIDWIKQTMAESDARGKVIVLDACHAGLQLGKTTPEPMTKAFEEAIFEKAEGFAILASCKMNELSHEWEEKEHGVFTYYLNEGLLGAADIDRDCVITISEASRYVSEKVKNWAFQQGYQQNPTLEYRVSGDLAFVYIPKGVTERKRVQKPKISGEPLDKCVTGITLALDSQRGEKFYEWASALCADLLNYFSPDEIKEVGKAIEFPFGSIVHDYIAERVHKFSISFSYDTKNRNLISRIISDLDENFWTELIYRFNKRFDPTKIVNWLRKASMNIESYSPGPNAGSNMSMGVSAKGWGRDGRPANVVFINNEDGSELRISQTTQYGIGMESNFFDKLNPKSILELLQEVLMDIKK